MKSCYKIHLKLDTLIQSYDKKEWREKKKDQLCDEDRAQKIKIREANSFVDSCTLSKKSPPSQVEQLRIEKQTRRILEFRYMC